MTVKGPHLVVLIIDTFFWALGELADSLEDHALGHDLKLVTITSHQVSARSPPIVNLLRSASYIHCLLWQAAPEVIRITNGDVPILVSVHHPNGKSTGVLSHWLPYIEALHTPATQGLEFLYSEFGDSAPPIHLIPYCLGEPDYVVTKSIDDLAPHSRLRIGFFSRGDRGRKDNGRLLDALHLAGGSCSRPLLVIVTGLGWEELEHSERIEWERHSQYMSRSEMHSLISTLDACLVTSSAEGGPLGALHALRAGIPVVSTSVGMIRDLAETTPGLILASTPEEIADALRSIANEDASRVDDLENRLPEIDPTVIAARYFELYAGITRESRKSSRNTAQRQAVVSLDTGLLQRWARADDAARFFLRVPNDGSDVNAELNRTLRLATSDFRKLWARWRILGIPILRLAAIRWLRATEIAVRYRRAR
jgi:glycosyltransferase involved in cell wall biosynthesis